MFLNVPGFKTEYIKTERVPKLDQLCHLIVLVLHIDQLAPELPIDPTNKLWQTEDSFKADFENAKICTMQLCKVANNIFSEKDSEQDKTFREMLTDVFSDFKSLTETLYILRDSGESYAVIPNAELESFLENEDEDEDKNEEADADAGVDVDDDEEEDEEEEEDDHLNDPDFTMN